MLKSHHSVVPVRQAQATKYNEVLAYETLKNKGFKIGDTLSLSQSICKIAYRRFYRKCNIMRHQVIFTNDATIAKMIRQLTGDKINAVVVRDNNWKTKN